MYEWGKKDNPEDKDGAEGQEKAEGGGGDGDGGDGDGEKPKVKKVKPNMERSGKLQEEALKTESGVVLKFAEPPEAKRPSRKWRLYPFKGDQALGSCCSSSCVRVRS
jgi:smad nuclear-interacting protein 1